MCPKSIASTTATTLHLVLATTLLLVLPNYRIESTQKMNKAEDVESQQQQQDHNNIIIAQQQQQPQQLQQQQHAVLGKHVMNGLTIAGIASASLVTIFRMFHVDVFLRVYELPLSTYSRASAIFSIVHTANNVVGAWLVDELAIRMDRSHLIGVSGCIFALLFLTPFFRWPAAAGEEQQGEQSSGWWDGAHFVASLSLYDALYAFTTILLGSVLTDSHNLTDKQRVQFMASGKVYNLVASFIVARIALSLFALENIYPFRVFLILLALLSSVFFVHGQFVIVGNNHRSFSLLSWLNGSLHFFHSTPTTLHSSSPGAALSPSKSAPHLQQQHTQVLRRRRNSRDEEHDDMIENSQSKDEAATSSSNILIKKLQWRRVIRDFGSMPNFRSWVVMEMLLEAQVTFSSTFLKTFMDRLVVETRAQARVQIQERALQKQDDVNDDNKSRGDNIIDNVSIESSTSTSTSAFSRETCDWLLAMIGPLSQVACIFCYIPIRKIGYPRVYTSLFVVNLLLSTLLLLVADGSCTHWIAFFLTVYPVLTTAVQSAGFHLAMSDMVLEMKRRHFMEGRFNEPSLAALFMGANALFCKPMESILPIFAASVMETTTTTSSTTIHHHHHHAQQRRRLLDADAVTADDIDDSDTTTKNSFFYLLVLPPLFFSIIQLLAWQSFNLTPARTAAMRQDLRQLQLSIAANIKDSHHHQIVKNKVSSSPGPD